jgi:hypothetical protein
MEATAAVVVKSMAAGNRSYKSRSLQVPATGDQNLNSWSLQGSSRRRHMLQQQEHSGSSDGRPEPIQLLESSRFQQRKTEAIQVPATGEEKQQESLRSPELQFSGSQTRSDTAW